MRKPIPMFIVLALMLLASTLIATHTYAICQEPHAEDLYFEHEPVIIEPEPEFKLTSDEVDLIAWVTVGEAEGESEYGQRLVIDTILNRVENSHYPDNVYDVIYQKSQFSCTTDGRLERCEPNDAVRDLVLEEAQKRTNNQTIFFRTGKYSKYGEPLFKEGAHYFSAYKE